MSGLSWERRYLLDLSMSKSTSVRSRSSPTLAGAGGENAGHARVEATAQHGEQAFFTEPVLVGPLPAIFEFSDLFGFVIGRIQIVYTSFQTGVHDGKVLVGQGDINDHSRLESVDELHQFGHHIRVHPGSRYFLMAGIPPDVCGDYVAFGLGTAGQ